MSEQVKVYRDLVFTGDGNNGVNVEGNPNPKRIFREWNFKELALDETNQYTKFIDTTSAVALADDGITLTTAATDTKTCSYAFGGIHVLCAKNPVVEFHFQIDVITTIAINAGLTDAVTEASAALPFTISGTTVSDTASNAAMFCFDTEQTTDRWYIVNTKANAEGGTLLSALEAPFAPATNIRVRVRLDSTGKAWYYFNEKPVGVVKPNATTAATALVPYFGIRNNSAAAHIATLRYVRLWEDA